MTISRFLQSATLAFAVFLGGCVSHQKLLTSDYSGVIHVACVGDSITYGAGVENRAENNYPKVLGNLLGPGFETRNFGVSGATFLKRGDKAYWTQPEFVKVGAFKPNAVVIKLGTNDSKPQNWGFKENFADDLAAMIDYFRDLPSKPKIWLCLPVPVYEAKWGINEPVVFGEIIPIIRRVAREKRVPVIDLHEALSGKSELFPDRIHPNAAGAAIIAATVKTALVGN